MCDIFRPGHFDGVTTIVKILLDNIKPSNIFFGEKDFQQLKIIEQMIIQNKLKIVQNGIKIVRNGIKIVRSGISLRPPPPPPGPAAYQLL